MTIRKTQQVHRLSFELGLGQREIRGTGCPAVSSATLVGTFEDFGLFQLFTEAKWAETGYSLLPEGVGDRKSRGEISTKRRLNLLGNLESLTTVLEALRNSLGAEL